MMPPNRLTPNQKTRWIKIIDDVPKTTPEALLETYVIEWCRWQNAENWIRENGDTLTIRNNRGVVMKMITAPQLKIAREAAKIVIDLAQKLGITN